MICKCCNRKINDLRFGICFDCANGESIIEEGTDMWDAPIEKKDGMTMSMSKLQEILKIFNVYKGGDKCSKNGVKKEGESCTLNDNCIYPKCLE